MRAGNVRSVTILLCDSSVVVNICIDEHATGTNFLCSFHFETTKVVPICAQDDGSLEVHTRLDQAVNLLNSRSGTQADATGGGRTGFVQYPP
jgi:hypothetical protein